MTTTDDTTLAGLLAYLAALPGAPAEPLEDWLRENDRWTWEECLRAVLSVPEADGLRLMAARWLDENAAEVPCGRCRGTKGVIAYPDEPRPLVRLPGGKCPACFGEGRVGDGRRERAEFVRVQVELARREGPASVEGGKGTVLLRYDHGDDYDALRGRERELWAGFGSPYERSRSFGLPPNWLAFLPAETDGVAVGYMPSDGDAVVRRGFVEAVTCTADVWLREADRVFWHPDQRVPCPVKYGFVGGPGRRWDPVAAHAGCETCSGKGTVPRPMPPTAHPIREVTLTTLTAADAFRLDALHRDKFGRRIMPEDRSSADGLARIWPGITFHTPR